MDQHPVARIRGTTAAEIVASVRGLVERGEIAPGTQLPPVRALADHLGVNRNTTVAAYRALARSGTVVTRGRAGTRVARPSVVPQEGFAPPDASAPRPGLRDVASGNPDPALIPDLGAALAEAGGRPVLYGEPVIDRGLEAWARDWFAADLPGRALGLTLTSGAVDAIERLLAQALDRDDAVALEAPCFLASLHTVHLGGYRAVPVPVDAEGMTVDGLRAALEEGVRAVVITPRAQNPTGASVTAERAAALREVLREHPYVLVIEDDYVAMLSGGPLHSVVGPEHERWALVRSVSKALGPDLCLAMVAADPETTRRLARRLSPGTTWVSHLLQRTTLTLLRDPAAQGLVERAGRHYAERNQRFRERLDGIGLPVDPGEGLSLWVPLPVPAAPVAAALGERGWLVRTGDGFDPTPSAGPSHHLRLTVHDLADDEAARLVTDLAAVLADRD